ncbi:adenosylcobinamide-GDP ribazoletransferase [Selenomonas ruminis]|uniref:Adenosylcobinamide-GDP ribazoletransferase n=2 Tax=Selenomonas TaxID=970 RepID=A0A5D6WF45_9FIRM|nr:adenosylcobinamide-GDP ribazoletransferase [Selenomonas sp. mPRGC5]TYZ25054.1 adenosylcobinamide-GDP ribazoletransferase [Selenomonas sp. mPRGC5]
MSSLRSFVLLLQFFTRLPLPWQIPFQEGMLSRAIIWLPLVGLVIGGINALAYMLGSVMAGPVAGVFFAMGANLFLTGAFHLDGLADTCDGIYSSRKRERMLEIMKDSRLGTNGACALLLVFLARYHGLLLLPENLLPLVIVLMPLSARACNPLLMLASYARKEGLGNLFIGKITWGRALVSVGIGALLVFALTANLWLLAAYLLLAVWQRLFTHYITGILGGMTGDTLGAGDELSEIIFLGLCCLGAYHGWL